MHLGRRPFPAGRAPGKGHEHRVQGRVADRPLRWRAAAMAHWRTASGLRRTCPDRGGERLRSDGQVVPSSAAAALTLSGRSASWKTRWASAQSATSGWAASHPWLEQSITATGPIASAACKTGRPGHRDARQRREAGEGDGQPEQNPTRPGQLLGCPVPRCSRSSLRRCGPGLATRPGSTAPWPTTGRCGRGQLQAP